MSQVVKMTQEEVSEFLDREFPQIHHGGRTFHVEEVGHRTARVRMTYHERHIRPGGTLSGPSMMSLADFSVYVAVLAAIGPVGLAVTTNLNINFLRKPDQKDLIARARLLKLGKRLAVGEVDIYSDGNEEDMVAHATMTYSIPPSS